MFKVRMQRQVCLMFSKAYTVFVIQSQYSFGHGLQCLYSSSKIKKGPTTEKLAGIILKCFTIQ